MKTIIKYLFYLAFILANFYLNSFVKAILEQEKCGCKTGWKIENLKLLSELSIFLGIINLVIPLNKTLYKIPMVGMIFSYGLLLILFMELFILVRYSRNLIKLKKCNGCNIDGFQSIVFNCQDLSLYNIILISGAVTVALLYL